MLKLSAHAPHSALVPCINIDPGPKNTAADAYKIEIRVTPKNGLSVFVDSLEIIQNIYSPMTMKPRLLNVLTGSLKRPPETVSHHLEAEPMIS
jgi:hypothetical protein